MPVPKKKTTKSAKNQRRSHHGLSKPNLTKCSNCQKSIAPHRVCSHCGYYKGKQVIDVKTTEEKKQSRKAKAEGKKQPAVKEDAKKEREKEKDMKIKV